MIYFINLLSMGFPADVATFRARRFSDWGELGYLTSIFLTLALGSSAVRFRFGSKGGRLRQPPLPVSDLQ